MLFAYTPVHGVWLGYLENTKETHLEYLSCEQELGQEQSHRFLVSISLFPWIEPHYHYWFSDTEIVSKVEFRNIKSILIKAGKIISPKWGYLASL